MTANKGFRVRVLAGLAGGAAEVAWVADYTALTGAAVARGVTTAFLPGMAD